MEINIFDNYIYYSLDFNEKNNIKDLTIIQNSKNTDICTKNFGSFSKMLKIFLDEFINLETLHLISINSNKFDDLDMYNKKIKILNISYCDMTENDMLLLGRYFCGIDKLIWCMNRFDEALFDQYIDPYFDYNYNMEYENDDGWYPGCEIWGDGQSLQFKNQEFYYNNHLFLL